MKCVPRVIKCLEMIIIWSQDMKNNLRYTTSNTPHRQQLIPESKESVGSGSKSEQDVSISAQPRKLFDEKPPGEVKKTANPQDILNFFYNQSIASLSETLAKATGGVPLVQAPDKASHVETGRSVLQGCDMGPAEAQTNRKDSNKDVDQDKPRRGGSEDKGSRSRSRDIISGRSRSRGRRSRSRSSSKERSRRRRSRSNDYRRNRSRSRSRRRSRSQSRDKNRHKSKSRDEDRGRDRLSERWRKEKVEEDRRFEAPPPDRPYLGLHAVKHPQENHWGKYDGPIQPVMPLSTDQPREHEPAPLDHPHQNYSNQDYDHDHSAEQNYSNQDYD